MKKYYFLIIVALILGLVLTGCSLLSNIGQAPVTGQSGITYLTKHTEGDPFSTNLIADGRDLAIDVGDVLVWNDGTTLHVKYVVTAPWCLTETHLHVATVLGEIPQKNGNPIPGKFEENDKHDCISEVEYMYDLLGKEWDFEDKLYIAAHAKAQNNSVIVGYDININEIYWSETAWAAGSDFSGKNWATYFTYTVQQLPEYGLVLWLDANAITGLSDGAKVATWDDLSGEDNHATQTTEANKPTYKGNVLNSKPVVRFDGVNDHLIIDALLAGGTSSRTIFIVAKSDTIGNKAMFMLNGDRSGTANARFYDITPEIWVRVFGNQQFHESFPTEFAILTIGNAENAKVNEIYGWLDESLLTAVGSANGDTTLNILGTRSSIGTILNDITTYAWKGDIAEILVYNRELYDSEREMVEAYLSAKYGL